MIIRSQHISIPTNHGSNSISVGCVNAHVITNPVKTNIIKNDGEKLPIDYLMRQNNDSWLVIDIFLKGRFSELAKQRAEYSSVIRRKGFDGLMTRVQKKVQLLTNGAP